MKKQEGPQYTAKLVEGGKSVVKGPRGINNVVSYQPDLESGQAVADMLNAAWTAAQQSTKDAEKFQEVTRENRPPVINPLVMSEKDIETAKDIARRLGFGDNTAYTSSSALWGLFCLPNNASQRGGCIIKTREFGLMFVADLEDMKMYDLNDAQHTIEEQARKA